MRVVGLVGLDNDPAKVVVRTADVVPAALGGGVIDAREERRAVPLGRQQPIAVRAGADPLPVGIVVAAAIPAAVAAVRPARGASRRVDLPGAPTATLATGAVIYGLVQVGSDGWGAATALVPLAAGLVLAGVFVAIERTAREPLVPLGLLARRPLLAGQLVMLAASALLLATFFLSSLYLQRALGFTALSTGLVFLPVALAIIVGSHLAARAVSQLGPRPVAAAAFILAAVGALLLSRLPADGQVLVDVLPGFLPIGAGMGASFVTATTTAMAHVDQHGPIGMHQPQEGSTDERPYPARPRPCAAPARFGPQALVGAGAAVPWRSSW